MHLLLQQGAETASVDYKRVEDLGELRTQVELAKDVAAFQAFGGHLVIGVDGRGRPTGEMTQPLARLFDEATLRPKMLRYLPEPLRLTSAVHEVDGYLVVLVYIHPHPDGFVVVNKDAEYEDDRHRKCVVMRRGDVFIRRGTSSERWHPSDVPATLKRRDARIREEAREEFARHAAAMEQARAGRQLASGPALSFSWRVDDATFESSVIELIRGGDDLPLNLFFRRVPGEARGHFSEAGPGEDLELLLDRVAQIAGIALLVEAGALFDRSVHALLAIYRLTLTPQGELRSELGTGGVRLWWSIITRVEAIGAAAIRGGNWEQVRQLVLQRPDDHRVASYYYVSWLRHALTEAARERIPEMHGSVRDTLRPGVLVHAARAVIHRLTALRMDFPDDTAFGTGEPERGDGPLLDSICQFDAAACVVSFAASGKDHDFYPSFSGLYPRRAEPVLRRILDDGKVRDRLFPGQNLDDVTQAVQVVATLAEKEGWQQRNAPYFFTDARLRRQSP
ncbi:ATP-binding protein [Streptomyces sp. B6B3]|uniref:AlbA family DNA-binding domain-containing protein n=1 Tax=Streptomyces sp. B6B3 TaxID=3153570 RepID=UPI00325FA2DE